MFAVRVVALCLLVSCAAALPARASAGPVDGGIAIDGPAAPDAPAVVARDDRGRATVRATRIPEALVIDGLLDEPIYQQVPAIGGFIQQEPANGAPASEQTDVWLFFDEKNIYVSARCWDTHPEREIANEMRRDGQNLINNENFGVILDTFYDRRNGFLFHVSAAGGMFDGYITDERDNNRDWNTVWTARTRRDDKGWVVEMAIPFKSLRYGSGDAQVWGINFRRVVRWKNEFSYLTLVPASYGMRGIIRLSSAGTLVGLEAPSGIRSLELKPYAIGGITTDREADPVRSNDLDREAGFDVKYGVTKSLTADFSYNTDFAQVEDDEQQVNLTRFSMFFPEKREFFLEGQGIFSFGGVQSGNNPGGGSNGDTPVLFFSRRIGLNDDGVSVPIRTGGRVTGRAGRYMVGVLNIQTEDAPAAAAPATNFSVVRVRRDVFRRSNVGIIGTARAPSGGASNGAFGTDANFAFGEATVNAYYAATRTPGRTGRDASWLGRYELATDRYGLRAEHLTVQENFNPEIGFLRRTDFRRNFAQARFSPRPAHSARVRKYQLEATLDYVTNNAGRLETRQQGLEFQTQLDNSDQVTFEYSRQFEYLIEPFEITDTVTIPLGGYAFQDVRASYSFGPQRKVSGWLNYKQGSFYGGSRREASYNGRVELSSRLSMEPRLSEVWVRLPYGDFTTTLIGARASYALSPRAAVGSLLQYNSNSASFSTNVRLRWEYAPGSDLFVVYNEGRDTDGPGYPHLLNRTFVVKIARLFRF